MPSGMESTYRPELCEKALSIMQTGASTREVAWELRCAHQTLWNWAKANPEFKEALELGKQYRKAWWERLGRGLATGQVKGNPAAYIFTMKAVYGWSDNYKVHIEGEVKVTGRIEHDVSNVRGKLDELRQGRTIEHVAATPLIEEQQEQDTTD